MSSNTFNWPNVATTSQSSPNETVTQCPTTSVSARIQQPESSSSSSSSSSPSSPLINIRSFAGLFENDDQIMHQVSSLGDQHQVDYGQESLHNAARLSEHAQADQAFENVVKAHISVTSDSPKLEAIEHQQNSTIVLQPKDTYPTISKQSGTKNKMCTACYKWFSNKTHLLAHKRNVHTGETPFKCYYCDRAFAHKGGLNTHLETHSGHQITCDVCNKSFKHENNLKLHLKSEAHSKCVQLKLFPQQSGINTEKFKCEQCSKSSDTKKQLTGHFGTLKVLKYRKCVDCGAMFTQTVKLDSNVKEHNENEMTLSSELPQEAQKQSAIEPDPNVEQPSGQYSLIELPLVHQTNNLTRQPKGSSTISEAIHNEQANSSSLVQQSSQPFERQIIQNAYNKQLVPQEAATVRKRFQCDRCSLVFQCKDIFALHYQTHTSEKPFVQQLQRSNSISNESSSSLLRSIKPFVRQTIKNIDNYKQKQSIDSAHSARYSLIEKLVLERNKHSSKLPCSNISEQIDNQLESSSSQLLSIQPIVHKENTNNKQPKQHENQKSPNNHRPVKCDRCPNRFKCKSHLARHYLTHTGEKPFFCVFCGQRFTQPSQLEWHLKQCDAPGMIQNSELTRASTELPEIDSDLNLEQSCSTSELNISLPEFTNMFPTVHDDNETTNETESQNNYPFDNRPVNCDQCSNEFTCKRHLERHYLTHTWEKPFFCILCGQMFREAIQLEWHLKKCNGTAMIQNTELTQVSTEPTEIDPDRNFEQSCSTSELNLCLPEFTNMFPTVHDEKQTDESTTEQENVYPFSNINDNLMENYNDIGTIPDFQLTSVAQQQPKIVAVPTLEQTMSCSTSELNLWPPKCPNLFPTIHDDNEATNETEYQNNYPFYINDLYNEEFYFDPLNLEYKFQNQTKEAPLIDHHQTDCPPIEIQNNTFNIQTIADEQIYEPAGIHNIFQSLDSQLATDLVGLQHDHNLTMNALVLANSPVQPIQNQIAPVAKSKQTTTGSKHSGKRLFKCKLCNKEFTRSRDEKAHQKSHLVKTHQCDVCQKFYKNAQRLSVHKDQKHNHQQQQQIYAETIEYFQERVEAEAHNPESFEESHLALNELHHEQPITGCSPIQQSIENIEINDQLNHEIGGTSSELLESSTSTDISKVINSKFKTIFNRKRLP